MFSKVYPFGYSAPGASMSLDALMQDEQTILVDIRYSVKSMRKPEWSGSSLQKRYAKRYLWIQDLGNENYYNDGPIKIHHPGKGIDRLMTGLQRGYNLILLCTCSSYETCHRKVVVNLLRGVMPEVEVIQPGVPVPEDSMLCLSIKQPWTFLIAHGHKDIENREWTTGYRGPLLLHAGSKVDDDWFYPARHPKTKQLRLYEAERMEVEDVMPKHIDEYPRGSIVGVCDLVDVVTYSDSKWFCGKYGFVLANARAFDEPIPYRGALKLFPVPKSVVQLQVSSV